MIMKHSFVVKWLVLVVIGLQIMSCTKSIRIPPSEYESVDVTQAKHWRITTLDEQTYWVHRFSVTDSTVVIHHASRLYASPNDAEPKYLDRSDLPIVLQRVEIASLERRETDKVVTTAVVSVLAISIIYWIWLGMQFQAIGGAS